MSTSTPADKSSFIRASTVWGVGSIMSNNLLCVLISSWSLLFLSTWGDLLTVNLSNLVGSGIGPLTFAPVLFAVLIISSVLESKRVLSKPLNLILIFWLPLC